MTNAGEGAGPTEGFIEKTGAKYPYAYDPGGKLSRWFGVRGIPHVVVVDPSGRILYRGSPNVPQAVLEEATRGTLRRPLFAWPDDAKKVRRHVEKRAFAKAIAEAEELGDVGSDVLADLKAFVASGQKRIEAYAEAGDWLAVEERGERLADHFEDLPEGEAIEALLQRLEDDDAAQEVLDAQKRVRKLTEGEIKERRIPRIERDLQEILEAHPDTAAARDAQKALERLRALQQEE